MKTSMNSYLIGLILGFIITFSSTLGHFCDWNSGTCIFAAGLSILSAIGLFFFHASGTHHGGS